MAVIYLNVEKVAESRGWDTVLLDLLSPNDPADPAQLEEPKATLGTNIINFSTSPAVLWVSIGVVAFTLGLWWDAVARRFDSERPTKLQRLRKIGIDCLILANDIEAKSARNIVPDYLHPSVLSLVLTLKKNGIPAPLPKETRDEAAALATYFRMTGKLLCDGHIKETKRGAKAAVAKFVSRAEGPKPSPPQGLGRKTRP